MFSTHGDMDEAIGNIMFGIEMFYGNVLQNKTTPLQKIDFLRNTPFYPGIELCMNTMMSLLIAEFDDGSYLDEIAPEYKDETIQEKLFEILYITFVIKKTDILDKYVSMVNWTDWHPLDAGDVELSEMYQGLIEYFPALIRFARSS